MIDEALEQKLIERFGDPDEGLERSEDIRESLTCQREAVAREELERLLEDVAKELGID